MLYRVVVKYLGHGEGGNATGWASAWETWTDNREQRIYRLLKQAINPDEFDSGYFVLYCKDGEIRVPTNILQRSVVAIERKEGNGGESAVLDGLTRYEASIAYGAAGGTDASCMVEDPEGEWVKLADVQALLDLA